MYMNLQSGVWKLFRENFDEIKLKALGSALPFYTCKIQAVSRKLMSFSQIWFSVSKIYTHKQLEPMSRLPIRTVYPYNDVKKKFHVFYYFWAVEVLIYLWYFSDTIS